jgi:hypothetical protein
VTFLVRRLFVGGAFWAAGLVALAVLLGSADRGGLGDVVDAFLADLRLPAGVTAAVELLALLLRAAATAALVLGAIVVLGRLLGRYLRRPGRSALPGALGRAATRGRAQLEPRLLELTLGRDSLAEPYEIAKLLDGLAGVLRPKARLHPRVLLGPDPLSLAIVNHPPTRSVRFALAVAPRAERAVLARIRATYPDVRARSLRLWDDVELVGHVDALRGRASRRCPLDVVRLKKRSRWLWALQTTKDYQHSLVDALVTTMSGSDVASVCQLVVTPAPALVERYAGAALRRRERHLRRERQANSVEPGVDSAVAQKQIKGALEGVGRALFWFDYRIAVPRGQPGAALELAGVVGEARQDNELRPRAIRLRRRLVAWRVAHNLAPPLPALWTGAVSAAELATLWHLPSRRVRGVGLERSQARELPASQAISRDPTDMLLVDEHGPLGIAPGDRRYGYAVIGAAGGGKSSIVFRYAGNVARDRSRALILADPKEDLARDVLCVVPRDRTVHYIDLAKPYCGLNPLALTHVAPEVRADILISALRETAGEGSIQARSDEFLRAATTAVCVVEQTPTLWHVRRMLDPFEGGYRDWVVRELRYHREVDFIRDYWEREFPAMVKANSRFAAEALNAPRNKLSRFLAVPSLGLLVNHPVELDLERIIAGREILIVNGSKGAVGEANAVLFLQLLVLLVKKTLHQLQRRERSERTQCALVIDEAHNVFTPSFATLLSEGRSAGLEAVAAFQYSEQIQDPRVKAGVKSLLQNISVTRLREFEDARAVAALAMDVFADTIRAEADEQRRLSLDPMDIINMPNHRPLNLWLAGGVPQSAHTGQTLPVEPLTASDGARRTRDLHVERQRRRGYHPHDDGRAIGAPAMWTAGRPVRAVGRTVEVDLGAESALLRAAARARAAIALRPVAGGEWTAFRALPDATGRRYRATVPSEPGTPGALAAGEYAVKAIIQVEGAPAREWQPAFTDGERAEPARVVLNDCRRANEHEARAGAAHDAPA